VLLDFEAVTAGGSIAQRHLWTLRCVGDGCRIVMQRPGKCGNAWLQEPIETFNSTLLSKDVCACVIFRIFVRTNK
jgi:hypothetical protein